MRERRSRSCSFLFCFTIPQPVDEDEAGAQSRGGRRLARWCLRRRFLGKIFRWPIALFPSLDGSGKDRKSKGLRPQFHSSKRESSHDDGWKTDSTLSLSSVSASSSLSSSSNGSFSSSSRVSTAAPVEQAAMSKVPRRSKTKGAAAGTFLLLSSLSMMVFCGRLSAIVWMAWILFVVCGYSASEQARAAAGMEAECLISSEVRRRRLVEAAEEKRRVILKGLLARNKKV